MKLTFTDERIQMEDGATWLCLKVADPYRARRFCMERSGKKTKMDAELKEHREKRSLDANAYAWVLIGKLAEATGIDKTEIYRNAIRDIGGNYETVCARAQAADAMIKLWTGRGLGWQAEQFPSKIAGCVNLNLYYGSSEYDTRQMARLIDNIVQDCKACGVETLTPDKLALLVDEWGKRNA